MILWNSLNFLSFWSLLSCRSYVNLRKENNYVRHYSMKTLMEYMTVHSTGFLKEYNFWNLTLEYNFFLNYLMRKESWMEYRSLFW